MSATDIENTESVIEVRDLGIRYRHFPRRDGWALQGINFELRRGEVLGLVGRNGAGKTSLLRTLAGITAADAGDISRDDNLKTALLTVNMGFVPHLPCRENVFLGAMLLGMPRSDISARYDDIMAFAELDVDPRQKVGSFSSGMRARLALGISLVAAPEVLLIDELLSVGDGAFRDKSNRAIRQLIKTDRSVMVVAHNIPVLRELCDRVLWIEDGTVNMIGPAETVLNQYRQAIDREPQGESLVTTTSATPSDVSSSRDAAP